MELRLGKALISQKLEACRSCARAFIFFSLSRHVLITSILSLAPHFPSKNSVGDLFGNKKFCNMLKQARYEKNRSQ